jgi:hypothetical protein
MFSKGIDAVGFAAEPRFRAVFQTRGSADHCVDSRAGYSRTHFEIDSADLGLFEASGRFNLRAFADDREVLCKWAEINPYSGGAVGSDSGDNLNNMMAHQQSMVIPGQCAVSFGFFDAGGYSGWSDRAYLYVTRDLSTWMGDLGVDPTVPFAAFTLPGSHDAGMFTVPESDEQARTIVGAIVEYWNGLTPSAKMGALAAAGFAATEMMAGAFAALLQSLSAVVLGVGVIAGVPRRALINLANTQKDTIAMQLRLGVRCFDCRPGYNLDGHDKVLRHQHAFVPGARFDVILKDITEFLVDHPQEVVVVQISGAGFMNHDKMDPAAGAVAEAITTALRNAPPPSHPETASKKPLTQGGAECFAKPYQTLVADNQRLIVFSPGSTDTRSSYTDDDYKTQDPLKVLHRLEVTLKEPEKTWTCLQLQGTYNGTTTGVLSGIANLSNASSPLMWTKSEFDRLTYPWALATIPAQRGRNLLVLLNDFADNALADVCIKLTQRELVGHQNLLKNGDARQGLTNWHIMANGGDGWLVEEGPAASCPGQTAATCFVSSYAWNTKAQTIDLVAEGYSAEALDRAPVIQVAEWYAGRSDCESFYRLIVELRDTNQRAVARFDSGILEAPLAPDFVYPWKPISYAFRDYGPGVRYVYFEHSGKDKKFWCGNYGSKMTGGRVIVLPQ